VELLFLPEHEPVAGHDLSTLHQQEREYENGGQDDTVSGSKVGLVDLPGDSTDTPFFLLHDRLALLVLFLQGGNRTRSFLTLPFRCFAFSRGFVDIFYLLLLLLRTELFQELGEDPIVRHELCVGSALHNLTVGNRVDVIDLRKEVQRVGDEDLGPTFGVVHEHLLEHRPPDMRIQSRKGILKVLCQSLAGHRVEERSHRKSGRRRHSK